MKYGEISSNGLAVRRRDNRVWFVVLGVFVGVFLFSFLAQRFKNDEEVTAVSLAGFDPGYIISDYQMGDYNSMSEAEIQSFLTAKNPCNNRDYSLYKSLSGATWHWEDDHFVCLSEEKFGDGEVIGSGDTAAHIIWQTAQDYEINPQVLLVLLQKETGLITDPIPNNLDYRKATGYGCPDTAACSSKYYGFKNQLRNAAALFRTVLDGGWTNYPLGNNYVQYNPNAACGGSVVNIRSLATSALYRYTPYQPNAGALAAGYGTAYCGAYGNRNFYLYFEDWFGGITEDGPKWETMAMPRVMTVAKSTLVIDARLLETTGEWLNENENYYYVQKSDVIWGGEKQTCLQRKEDEGTNKCVLMARVSELSIKDKAVSTPVSYYEVNKWTCAVGIARQIADCEKNSYEEGRILKIDREIVIGDMKYYIETGREDGYGILAARVDKKSGLEEFFVAFKHPRNLLINRDTKSININTGEECAKYRFGTIRRFVKKIDYDGLTYYQNWDEVGTPCVIESTDLSETIYNFNEADIGKVFVDFLQPRELVVGNEGLYSIDVKTGFTCDEYLSAGDIQRYITKIDMDEAVFFRTENNTRNDSSCAVPASKLFEI